MSLFNSSCAVCAEKDNRINDLLNQVAMLRTMVMPASDSRAARRAAEELDLMVSGADTYSPTLEEVDNEATRLLTGGYDDSQVDAQ